MRPIALSGFEAKFAGDNDPWSTFTDPDEALKREAILHAMGTGPWGRVLEIAAGNGSNSAAIAPRALRLDATEATVTGTALVARAIRSRSGRARAIRMAVPAHPTPQPLRHHPRRRDPLLPVNPPNGADGTCSDRTAAPRWHARACPSPHRLSGLRAARRSHPKALPGSKRRAVAGPCGPAHEKLDRRFLPQ